MWDQLEPDRWYHRSEIAKIYGCTIGTVSRWISVYGGLERREEWRERHYIRRDGSERSTLCRVALWRLEQ